MFALFAWLMKKAVSPITLPSPDSGIYVARFRKELNSVAKEFENHGYPSTNILFRATKKDCWVDFYNRKGMVAQVRVHGEMGLPDEVIVDCNLSVACKLPIEAEALFVKFFPDLRVTFKARIL